MKIPLIMVTLLMFCLLNQGRSQSIEVEAFVRPAITSLHGNPIVEENFDLTFHFSAGIGTNILFERNSLVHIGLIYERKGGHGRSTLIYRDENNRPIRELELNIVQDYDYLTLPVLYKLRFGEKMKIQAGGGLYAAYLLRRLQIDETELLRVQSSSKEGNKAFDFGLAASIEIYLPMSKKLYATVGISEYFGLLNISTVPVFGDGSIRHQSFGTMLGIRYTVK